MVVSNILGGIGNQMFQYAAGRALASKLRVPLMLDVSGFQGYQLHNGFELSNVFEDTTPLANKSDLFALMGWQSNIIIRKILLRPQFSALRNRRFIVEPHFHYWPDFEKISASAYLTGYWQSERYFKSIESTIRNDFTFKLPMSAENKKIADKISQCNAISLHIRRGDYIKNATTLAIHGVCSLDYYYAAIKYIDEKVMQPTFFIFSDDMSWVKNNFLLNHPCEYININHGTESYNDMRLMSLCAHNIIANSSFSWWGAWLNKSKSKIVIYPKKWFQDATKNTKDLHPENWIGIDRV